MPQTKLAILGLGSRSTLYYLSELNRLYHLAKGGYSTCPFLLLNTNFDTINSLLPNTSKALDAAVNHYINDIEKLEVQQLIIPNITLHSTIDRLQISKHIIHPIVLSIEKIKAQQWQTIVLFGSYYSMTSPYIAQHLEASGIEVLLPTESDMRFLDVVRRHVYYNTETNDVITKYHNLIHRYLAKTPVILSCTELSILKPIGNVKLLDMADIQIEQAIQTIIE
ncbi:aspartate/glutamate racemase family protein [Psychroserpens damuponensis]|uniref:aspartate/glutamate racemase family protein n=1 Tax=Psychroserpens damuponensis TaxID=943936 RepID=UPI00058C3A2A|nr:aspartate/glutamate racemase family protein [Psychroserpens damuponensis]